MNASNHLRRAVSSLTRGIKGIVLAINAKDGLQFLFRVLVQLGVWSSSTWVPRRFSVGRQSVSSHFVASQHIVDQLMPDKPCKSISGASAGWVTLVLIVIVPLMGTNLVTGYLRTVLCLLWHT